MAAHDTITPGLTAEELLAELAQPDLADARREQLLEQLTRMHRGLIMEAARRYRYRGEPFDDILQAAYLGLMKAIRGYDPSLGHAFSGYAMVTINGEVKRHFRDRTWAIRVPRVYQDRRAELNAVTGELTQDLGRSPTVAELARRMNISEEDVLLTMDASAAYRTLSLDVPTGMDDDSTVLADLIAADDNSVDLVIDKHALRPLVRALPERERTILKLRFFDDRTQKEIADELGISQMHVSRILSKTFAHLRTELLAPC